MNQHRRDSPSHKRWFSCNQCNRGFGQEQALNQHCRDSPDHKSLFSCNQCNRGFRQEQSLKQHQRVAPFHQTSEVCFSCNQCNRSFRQEEALKQHLRDEPSHRISCTSSEDSPSEDSSEDDSSSEGDKYPCDACGRVFYSDQALSQHCKANKHPYCDRCFIFTGDLAKHKESSDEHHICATCKIDFPTVNDYVTHIISAHLKLKQEKPQIKVWPPEMGNVIARTHCL